MLSAKERAEKIILEDKRVIVRIWTSSSNPIIRGTRDVGHISLEVPASKKYMSLWPFQGSFTQDPKTGEAVYKPSASESETIWAQMFSGVEAEDLASFTYEKDLEFEEGPPQVVLCFYRLEPIDIEDAYSRSLQIVGGQKWSLLGLGSTQSCASFAYGLLQDGGLGKFYTFKDSALSSSRLAGQGSSAASQGVFKGSSSSSSSTGQSSSSSSSAKGSSFFAAEALAMPFIASPDILVQRLMDAKKNELKKYQEEGKLHLIPEFPTETKVEIENDVKKKETLSR